MSSPLPFFADEREQSLNAFFHLAGYEIYTEDVLAYHRSDAAIRIASAPARTSKSFSAAHDMGHDFFPERDGDKHFALPKGGDAHRCWVVALDFKTQKEFDYLFTLLLDKGLVAYFKGEVEQSLHNPAQGNCSIRVRWPWKTRKGEVVRSILEARSAQNERSLQGDWLKAAVMSEAAEQPQRVLEKYLQTRVGRLTLPTTPKRGARWIHDLIELASEDPTLGIEAFHYRIDPDTHKAPNPDYPWGLFDQARRRAEANYLEAHLDPEFAEQFLGVWTFHEGAVMPFLDREVGDGRASHVIGWEPDGFAGARWFVSIDYGYNDAAVALLWCHLPDDRLVVWDEVYESGLNASRFGDKIHEMTEQHDADVGYYVGDPKRPEIGDEIFVHYDLPVHPRNKSLARSRAASCMALVELLSVDPDTNQPRLQVHERCTKTIDEWKKLRRKDGWTGDEWSHGAFAPSCKDHAFDAARYGAVTVLRETPSIDHYRAMLRDRQRWVRRQQQARPRVRPPLVGRSPGLWA